MLVWIRSSLFLMEILIFVTPFSQGWYLFIFSQYQLPTPDNSFWKCWVFHAGRLCISSNEKFSFLICFLPASGCPPRVASCHFLFFSTVFAVALIEITFSMRKLRFWRSRPPPKIHWQWILENQLPHSSSLILTCFFYFFKFEDSRYAEYFSPHPLLHYGIKLVLGMNQGETHSTWMRRGNATSILKLGVGFRAVANFKFSALVKFLFSQLNWPSTTAFLHLTDKGGDLAARADLKVRLV